MNQYYDTDRLPGVFATYRRVATGGSNWDYFINPAMPPGENGPWVYAVAKVAGCRTTGFGEMRYLRGIAQQSDIQLTGEE